MTPTNLPEPRPSVGAASLFWLTYKQGDRLLGVIVADSSALIGERFRAAVDGVDRGADFVEVHELDHATAALVPATALYRVLTPDEAAKLIRRIERGIPKRPAVASVKRHAARGRKRA